MSGLHAHLQLSEVPSYQYRLDQKETEKRGKRV